MNKIYQKYLVFGVLILSQSIYADGLGWLFHPGKADQNSEFHQRLPEKFQDDITSDQDASKVSLSPAEKHQALVWGLTDNEEKRYLFLMQNQSGVFYTGRNVTPVEILGFNARTDSERQKYAKIDASQQMQYMAKYLAYVSDYQQAAKSLKDQLNLPIVNKFNYSPFSPYSYHPIALQQNDKLMLFIHRNDAVKPIVASLLSDIEKEKTISLNIYFVGKRDNQSAVEKWAQDQNIPPEFVKSHRITLNIGNSQFESLTQHDKDQNDKKTPVLILIRNNESRFVDLSRF